MKYLYLLLFPLLSFSQGELRFQNLQILTLLEVSDGSYATVTFNNLLENPTELNDEILSKVVKNIMEQSSFTLY